MSFIRTSRAHIDSLVQDYGKSTANANTLELPQSSNKPSIYKTQHNYSMFIHILLDIISMA